MLTIGGVAVKNPTTFEVTIEDIYGTDETNANGDSIIDIANTKRVLSVGWGLMTQSEMAALLGSMDDGFFTIQYPDPYLGVTTKTFKVSERTAAKSLIVRAVTMWDGMRCEFRER